MTPDQVAAHEAGHAVACVLLGVPVSLIDTIGDEHTTGRVFHDHQIVTRGDAIDRMKIVLAGLIESAEHPDDLPEWPLRPGIVKGSYVSDEHALFLIAQAIDLTEDEYRRVVIETLQLTTSRGYRLLHTAVCGFADHVPIVTRGMLADLVLIAERRT